MAAKKTDPAKTVIDGLQKKFKQTSVRSMAEAEGELLKEVIPTGIEGLDNYVLGIGGLPIGRCTELYGGEDAGKTSLGFQFLGAAQRAGGLAVLVETENTLVAERGPIFGLDPSQAVLAEPESIDLALAELDEILNLIPKGVGPNVMVWDSLAASPADASLHPKKKKKDKDGNTTEVADAGANVKRAQPGEKARQMSEMLPVITQKLAQKRVHLVILNQIRMKIGVVFGSPITTPGGNALKFMASQRLEVFAGKAVKEGGTKVGQDMTIRSVKTKFVMPNRKIEMRLDFRTGFDNEWILVNLAKDLGVIAEGRRVSDKTIADARAGLLKHEDWGPPKSA